MRTDFEPVAAAIKTALDAALPASVGVYDIDEVPGAVGGLDPDGTLPAMHVEILLSPRFVAERRFSGEVMLPGGELLTRYHAGSVTSVRELRRLVSAALEDVALPLPAPSTEFVGPFVFQIGEAEDFDDTGCTALDIWSF